MFPVCIISVIVTVGVHMATLAARGHVGVHPVALTGWLTGSN